MEAFYDLRRKAKDVRATMIVHAREQYESSLRRIAELERDLVGESNRTHKSVAASVEAAMPKDRPFKHGRPVGESGSAQPPPCMGVSHDQPSGLISGGQRPGVHETDECPQ